MRAFMSERDVRDSAADLLDILPGLGHWDPFDREGQWRHVLWIGSSRYGSVWIAVGWDGRRLSLSGVEGPKSNGDAHGSCGQIRDVLGQTDLTLRPEWTPDMVRRLRAEWERWHLNDMRAGCEHQRKAGWDTRPINPGLPLDVYGKHTDGISSSWNMLTWITPAEHPDGLLAVPCPECGYRYGTAWKFEAVPADVLEWLQALPQAETECPWRNL